MRMILACIILITSIINPFVYKDTTEYESDIGMSVLVGNILDKYDEMDESGTLKYEIKVKCPEGLTQLQYGEKVRDEITDFLWGVTDITPGIRVAVGTQKISFTITKHVPTDEKYWTILNSLVADAKTKDTDVEKLAVLQDYLRTNDFIYSKSFANTNTTIKTGNMTESPHLMPDGVLVNKTGICVGYSNLVSVFCKELGIKNIKLVGKIGSVEHMWNLVYIEKDGKTDWYAADATYTIGGYPLVQDFEQYLKHFKIEMNRDIIDSLSEIKYDREIELEVEIPQTETPASGFLFSKSLLDLVVNTFKYALK